jgi:hypothetical protein
MAGSASDWAELKILEHMVGKTSWTMPTVYVALMTAAPGEANSGSGLSEVANSNNYARKSTAGGDWNSASAGAIANANAITFNQASGSWGTVSHFALMTSPVHGEGYMIAWGDLTTPKAIDSGDTPEFAAGELDITCD